MFPKPHKFLMSEEGASPGGGATPIPSAEPTATTPAPALDVDSLLTRLSGVIDEKIAASQNATHAALRKAGVFKQEKTASESSATTSQPTTSAPSTAQAGLSMADVEALLERERVIATRAAKHNLTDAQTRRLKASLIGVAPESFAAEVDSYLTDMGLVRPTETPASAPAQPAPSGPPLSDKGSPAPGGVVNWEREFAENPGFMSTAARAAMDAKYGHEKARRMRIEAVNAPGGQAERLRVVTK